MKKILISVAAISLCAFALVGCSKKDANKELAKSIENKSTNLVYSIETMDNVSFGDLNDNTEVVATSAAVINTSVPVVRTQSRTKPTQSRMRGINPTSSTPSQNIATSTTRPVVVGNQICTTNNCQNQVSLTTTTYGNTTDYQTQLIAKRADVMLLCSKLRRGDIKVSTDEQTRINDCLALIDSTSSYLDSTKGTLSSALQNSKSTASKVALREKIAIRQAKLQTGILAMDEIMNILSSKEPANIVKQTINKTAQEINKQTQSNTQSQTKTTTNGNKNTTSSPNPAITTYPAINRITTAPIKQNTNSGSSRTTTTTQNSNKTQTNNSTTKTSFPNTTTNINSTTNPTNTNQNDAVSILVKPIKTQNSTYTNQNTTQNNTATNYIVSPSTTTQTTYQNNTKSYNAVRNVASMPQKPLTAQTLPYVVQN